MSDDAPRMTSYRPYLLRALTEWINDNGMTPHILVDAGVAGVRVPPGVVREGKVVLNIADRAVVGLRMDNEWIEFAARFGGVSQPVSVPVAAVLAVYARETGQGMVLPEEAAGGSHAHAERDPDVDGPDTPPEGPADPTPGKRPHLRVVK
ncbi:ClpXP protease specificity-enhancing factor [Pseudoxanthomonas suwonensis]|uniref:Peptidase n=1 Tax=Pseudoxanthomonas suwonensis TaxID=314722 RepID=A0A0E3Z2L4_9GAMM|nr:ClpXP protease specificity-enhancing factor [Pseudoxanthomonas suwonensis]AKC87463.1 peptidase [Pseudoxanthomonas suwonensis]